MAHGCVVAVASGLAPALQDTLFGLYLAKWVAQPWHGTGTSQQGMSRHGTSKHDDLSMPCHIGSPCPDLGPSMALNAPSHAVPNGMTAQQGRASPAPTCEAGGHARDLELSPRRRCCCCHATAAACSPTPPLLLSRRRHYALSRAAAAATACHRRHCIRMGQQRNGRESVQLMGMGESLESQL
jgi:hypothetical protein